MAMLAGPLLDPSTQEGAHCDHRRDLRVVALAVLIFMTDGFDLQVVAFVGTSILRSFGQPLVSLGPLLTWGVVGILIGAVILGAASDRIGRRMPLTFSLLLFALGTLATSFVKNFDQIAPLRLLTGIGLGGAMPSLYALCAENARPNWRALTITLAACGNPLGAALGGLICAEVVPDHGWRVVFKIAGLFSVALVPLVWWLVSYVRPVTIGSFSSSGHNVSQWLRELLRRGLCHLRLLFSGERRLGTPLIWLTCFSAVLTAYFLVSWTPALAERAGLSPRLAILAGVLLNVGAILGGALLSRLIDKRGVYRVLGYAFVIATGCIALIGWSWHVPALFLGNVLLVGIMAFGCAACVGTFSTLFYPDEIRGTGVGFAMAFAQLGGVVGPFIGGLLVGAGLATATLFLIVAGNTLLPSLAIYGLSLLAETRARIVPTSDNSPESVASSCDL